MINHRLKFPAATFGILLVGQLFGSALSQRIQPTAGWYSLKLGYGIHLRAPVAWRVDDTSIAAAIRSGKRVIDATSIRADDSGHVITFAEPSPDIDSSDVSILILPTRIGQREVASLTEPEIRNAEANDFRPEIERAVTNNGAAITSWYGTKREKLGGLYVLVTSYRYKTRAGTEMMKSTYSAYLGTHAIHIHAFQRVNASAVSIGQLRRLIHSIVFEVDSL